MGQSSWSLLPGRWALPIILWILAIASPTYGQSLELFLPGNNVSSRPVLEFRARGVDLGAVDGVRSIGHAYILLGRELDNGQTIFNKVAGFYPDEKNAPVPILAVAYGPGKVSATLKDASSQVAFRVYITPLQEGRVSKLLDRWDTKNYSLVIRNCVDLVRDVARTVGLTVPFISGDLSQEYPTIFIRLLRDENQKDTPLKVGAPPATGTQGTSAQPGSAPLPPSSPNNSIDAGKQTLDAIRNATPGNLMPTPVAPPAIPATPPLVYTPPLPPLNPSPGNQAPGVPPAQPSIPISPRR